jgi:signal transduction histidine kinase
MALSKGIVLAHHGEIRAEESGEGGAAIVVRLPLTQPREVSS